MNSFVLGYRVGDSSTAEREYSAIDGVYTLDGYVTDRTDLYFIDSRYIYGTSGWLRGL